ncbi:Ku protein [Streptomyces lydicus]|uniref:Ku protein n=1 Tax=Streptomyces lydicus TaxID=47763 RepID=UPI003D669D48
MAPITLDRSSFLGGEGAGARPYRLLRDAMKQSGQVGIARMALRGPERLVVLRTGAQPLDVLGQEVGDARR